MKLSLLFLIAGAYAEKYINYRFYNEDGKRYLACGYISASYLFCDDVSNHYMCYCLNKNAMATMAGCVASYGKLQVSFANYYCDTFYGISVSEEDYEEAYQYYLNSSVNPYETLKNYTAATDLLTVPVTVNSTAASIALEAYEMFLGNYDHSIFYGIGAIGYWFAIALVSGIANWSVILFPGLRNIFNGRVSKAWRKYVTLPALWSRKRSAQQDFLGGFLSFLVPSRLESIYLFVFFWLLVAINITEIKYVKNDPIFATRKEAILRYVADRTGLIPTVMVPLLVLFGGRNNFLQWVTRWRFSTFLLYHRWIARFMTILILIHSIAYTRLFIIEGYFTSEMEEDYLRWGVVSTVCSALICFQGLLWLRRSFYEMFLVIHIVLAVFFVVSLWYHIAVLDYPQLVYPVFAIWVFDRVVRVVRIAYFGLPQAKIELLDHDALKVTVPKPGRWKGTPGGHSWLYFVQGWRFWQSHPFTYIETTHESGTDLVFYCKIKGGITSKLCKKIALIPGRTLSMRIGVEGPYGYTSPVQRHSSVTYIAGGNGIPGIFSESLALGIKAAERGESKQKIKLIWIMRELKQAAWFLDQLKRLSKSSVETVIYVTRPIVSEEVDAFASEKSAKAETSSHDSSEDVEKYKGKDAPVHRLSEYLHEQLPEVNVIEERPNLEKIIKTGIEESEGSIAFVTCGHPSLVDDIRYTVVRSIDETEKRVDFFEQVQTWA